MRHRDADLHDLMLNLRDQVEDLAGGPRRLTGLLDMRRGRRPRGDDGYFEQMTWCVFKAGISAAVVNRKWSHFRKAFAGFSIPTVAAFTGRDVTRLTKDPGIIRYRGKIEATVANAREMLAVRGEFGSFRRFLTRYGPAEQGQLYVDLRRRFSHLGPYTVRAFLRRVGEDVFYSHADTLRVLYRLGLIKSPRAPDPEVGQAHARLAAATPGSRVDEINRLVTRFGSGYELDDAICADVPKCHRCAISHWCWYYREVRTPTQRRDVPTGFDTCGA
ncbi:MAG: DNA-3-methyladenine glycosylase I [Armatimonadota bacterium]|nr:DNA-3-methyladenine glycosylase I [Armatimonadota bacterium]